MKRTLLIPGCLIIVVVIPGLLKTFFISERKEQVHAPNKEGAYVTKGQLLFKPDDEDTRLITAEFKAKLTETELLLLSGKLIQ